MVKAKADLNIRDNHGDTLLKWTKEHSEIFKEMLRRNGKKVSYVFRKNEYMIEDDIEALFKATESGESFECVNFFSILYKTIVF